MAPEFFNKLCGHRDRSGILLEKGLKKMRGKAALGT